MIFTKNIAAYPFTQRFKNAGFILLPVVLAMSLIAAIAFLLNRDNGMNVNMVSKQMDKDRAYYTAEAGLQAVNARIQALGCTGSFPTSLSPISNSSFGTASYSAYSEFSALPSTNSNPNTINLVATGTYNGTAVTLKRSNVYVYQSTIQTITLTSGKTTVDETYIRNGESNHGGESTFRLSNSRFPLLKFDLSIFPTGSIPFFSVTPSATLSVFDMNSNNSSENVNLNRVTSAWDEGSVNWTKRTSSLNWTKAGGDYYPSAVVNGALQNMGAGVYKLYFDITNLMAAWMSGSYENFGVILDKVGGDSFWFESSESSDVGHRPKIDLNYLLPCGATAP